MSQTEQDDVATTEGAIAQWLVDRIRFYDQVDPALITIDAPLSELALDSIYAMMLCGDIEDKYDIGVEPTLFAGLRTLGDVASVVAARVQAP